MATEDKTLNSSINIDIQLDTNKMPDKITWASTDGNNPPKECGAFMLAIWDRKADESLRIDLWDKDMRKDEMDKFFFQTIMTMADTYLRSNGDEATAGMIRDFGYNFGEKTQLVRKKSPEEAAAEQAAVQGKDGAAPDLAELAKERQKPDQKD